MSSVIRAQCDPFLNKSELMLGKPGFIVIALDNACEACIVYVPLTWHMAFGEKFSKAPEE